MHVLFPTVWECGDTYKGVALSASLVLLALCCEKACFDNPGVPCNSCWRNIAVLAFTGSMRKCRYEMEVILKYEKNDMIVRP